MLTMIHRNNHLTSNQKWEIKIFKTAKFYLAINFELNTNKNSRAETNSNQTQNKKKQKHKLEQKQTRKDRTIIQSHTNHWLIFCIYIYFLQCFLLYNVSYYFKGKFLVVELVVFIGYFSLKKLLVVQTKTSKQLKSE